jgi:hypothetical protein
MTPAWHNVLDLTEGSLRGCVRMGFNSSTRVSRQKALAKASIRKLFFTILAPPTQPLAFFISGKPRMPQTIDLLSRIEV